MRLHLWAFGKLKAPGLAAAASHYQGMLKTWTGMDVFEFRPLPVSDKSPSTRKRIQEEEAALVSKRLEPLVQKGRAALYLLDERGKATPTQAWAELVHEWEAQGLSDVILCVGSSLGFDESLRKRARGLLSLGPQTLSHELARVVLIEQLYRAWSVVKGHPYHNEGS